MDLADQERFCELLAEGRPRTLAAHELGYLPGHVERVIASDDDFKASVLAAEAAAVGEIEHAVMQKAKAGHFPAAKFVLTNRDPDRWQDRRTVEHQGRHEVQVNVELQAALTKAIAQGGREDIIDLVEAIEDIELAELGPGV